MFSHGNCVLVVLSKFVSGVGKGGGATGGTWRCEDGACLNPW